jgi:hypothetical protein
MVWENFYIMGQEVPHGVLNDTCMLTMTKNLVSFPVMLDVDGHGHHLP